MLAGVFLTVTGGEALYADMGHFGKSPIRLGWMCIVMPALVLNYFGQGALLIENPAAISNPFYLDGARSGRCCRWWSSPPRRRSSPRRR